MSKFLTALKAIKPAAAIGTAQAIVGAGQMLFSGRKKAERELMGMKNPVYQRDKGITDFYQQAKNRAFENLLTNPEYLEAKRRTDEVLATGMQGLQDRRSGVAGVSRLVGLGTQAGNQQVATAQRESNRRFSELGSATQAMASENRRAFDINVMQPFQREDMLRRQRLAAANARFDAGLQNIGGSFMTKAMLAK